MVKKDPARKRYPSELTDEQWAIVAPLIPPVKSGPAAGTRVRSTCGTS
jgi:transposase